MTTIQHMDAMGNELKIGDFVVTTQIKHSGLIFGKIEEGTKNKVRVRWGPKTVAATGVIYDFHSMLKDPSNVCKIDGPDACAYVLRMGI